MQNLNKRAQHKNPLWYSVSQYSLLAHNNIKQQNFASTFPAQVQVELMGVGDMGHWETRTLIGFPLLSSAPQCILHPRRCTAGGEWEFWTLWGLAIIALPANTAVTAAVVTDGWWVGWVQRSNTLV